MGSGPTTLVPRGDVPFFVFVGSAADADEVWSMYQSQRASGTFDVRRGNVFAISDAGLTAPDRARVKAALSSLPDRGSPVLVVTGQDWFG